MLKKLLSQTDARLEGEFGMDPQMIYDLAEQIAATVAVDGFTVKQSKYADGQHYAVCQGTKVVSSFCVWSSKELMDKRDQPTGRRKVYADWDDEVIDNVGKFGESAEDDGVVKFFARMVVKNVRGVPGSVAYRAFLEAYRRVLVEADETEPVKEFETIRQQFFCASVSIVGLLIHATVGSFGGDGRRWRNRAGLAA